MATFKAHSLQDVVKKVVEEAHFPQVLVLLAGRPAEVQLWYTTDFHAKAIYQV